MPDVALWHRLYTHGATDARWETTGGKFVELERDARRVLPEEARRDLDDLMQKTGPAHGATGYAVRRYSGEGGDTFAVVVASYGRLISDTGKRGGRLTHARVVKVRASEPLFDMAALVDAAEAFGIEAVERAPEERRVATYLDFVAAEQAVSIAPVTIDALRTLPRTFLCSLLAAGLHAQGRRERVRFLLPEPEHGSLAMAVARGWAALPVALQRGSSWAVDVDEGCPTDVMLSSSAGRSVGQVVKPQVIEIVTGYVNVLLEGPHDCSDLLRDPAAKSLGWLKDAVQQYRQDAVQQVRTMDTKKGRGSEPVNPGVPMDAAELDRQYKAMELSLKAYVDQRIEALEPGRPGRGAAVEETVYEQQRPRMVTPGTVVNWKPWLAAGVVAALLIAGGSWWYFRGRKTQRDPDGLAGTTQSQVEVTATTEPAPIFGGNPPPDNLRLDTVRAAIANGSADGKFAESLKSLLEQHGAIVSAAMRSAANGTDLDGNVVTTDARDDLMDLARRIDAKDALTSDDREAVRRLLLDYTAALAARDQRNVDVRVDGKLGDVTADLLRRLKEQYRTVTKSADKTSIDLQSEIILRWLETSAR